MVGLTNRVIIINKKKSELEVRGLAEIILFFSKLFWMNN